MEAVLWCILCLAVCYPVAGGCLNFFACSWNMLTCLHEASAMVAGAWSCCSVVVGRCDLVAFCSSLMYYSVLGGRILLAAAAFHRIINPSTHQNPCFSYLHISMVLVVPCSLTANSIHPQKYISFLILNEIVSRVTNLLLINIKIDTARADDGLLLTTINSVYHQQNAGIGLGCKEWKVSLDYIYLLCTPGWNSLPERFGEGATFFGCECTLTLEPLPLSVIEHGDTT